MLQHQIAAQLGLSSEEFGKANRLASVSHRKDAFVGSSDAGLVCKCLEMLVTYCRITDIWHCIRFLSVVHDVSNNSLLVTERLTKCICAAPDPRSGHNSGRGAQYLMVSF